MSPLQGRGGFSLDHLVTEILVTAKLTATQYYSPSPRGSGFSLDHLVTEILVTAKSTAELLQGSDSQSFPPQWGRMSFCDRRGAVFSLRKKTVPHLAPHFKLGRALQSWEKVTCVAPSPFGEEIFSTKSTVMLYLGSGSQCSLELH